MIIQWQTHTAKCMRQFHIFLNQTKTWLWIVCRFLCFYLFLPLFAWCDHNIVLQIKTKQFYDHIMQKVVKTGKKTEINKEFDFKFSLKLKNIWSCLISIKLYEFSLILQLTLIFWNKIMRVVVIFISWKLQLFQTPQLRSH